MPGRAHWKGYLKLSLVSCPIALYPATSAAERISFREVNRRTGHRLRHQLVDSVTGEAVGPSEKGRGYEVGENRFVLVEDAELEQARHARPQPGAVALAETPRRPDRVVFDDDEPEADVSYAADGPEPIEEMPPAPIPRPQNTHTIEIERFLPGGEIDARYHDKPYYIVPRDAIGQEAYAVIRDAMRDKEMAALGRVVLSSRERPILIEPMGNGLRGLTLRFAHEVRPEAEYFSGIAEIALPAEMLKLAEHIIETKAAAFDPAMLEDHYRNALMDMLRKKPLPPSPGMPRPVTPSREDVIDLMDALRRSLAAERPLATLARRRAAAGHSRPAKRSGTHTRKAR